MGGKEIKNRSDEISAVPQQERMIMFACELSVCGTHGADCSAEPVSAARSDSAYQE